MENLPINALPDDVGPLIVFVGWMIYRKLENIHTMLNDMRDDGETEMQAGRG